MGFRGPTISLLIGIAALLILGALPSRAATFELVPLGDGAYAAALLLKDDEGPLIAVDAYIRLTDGAAVSAGRSRGNVFGIPVFNPRPQGHKQAVMIGGADAGGSGRTGKVSLGEIDWNGRGTLSLSRKSKASNMDTKTGPEIHGDCKLATGDLVLVGQDADGDGIPNACECGDPNGTGEYEQADLFQLFGCLIADSSGEMEACATHRFNGDTNASVEQSSLDVADLFVVFERSSETAGGSGQLTCPARPKPWAR